MDVAAWIESFGMNYTLRTVALGAGVLGIVSGALGAFAVLRRQSLLGDAISHAALPGIVLAFMLTRSKVPLVLMIGAALAGWLAVLLLMSIANNTRIKLDSSLGFILSVFFGFGLVLLTFVQRLPDARQAGLETFLFGQAAVLLESDVITMGVLGGIALFLLAVFWKEFKLLSFDREFGATLGFPMRSLDILLTTLLVVAIVIGLQAVGVVLMSAMIVAPAAAARQWTDRLGVMVLLSSLFGAMAGVAGALISSLAPGLSTGPTIVICISAVVLFSLLLAPNRGLLWGWVRSYRRRYSLSMEAVLGNLYILSSQHEKHDHPHNIAVLRAMSGRRYGIRHSLKAMEDRGWVNENAGEEWSITDEGVQEAQRQAENRRGIDLEEAGQ
jgi:manganese/zinc/iron transport system permease protein